MCHIGTWSTRYCMRTAEKVWRSKVKKYMVCWVSKNDTRQTIFFSLLTFKLFLQSSDNTWYSMFQCGTFLELFLHFFNLFHVIEFSWIIQIINASHSNNEKMNGKIMLFSIMWGRIQDQTTNFEHLVHETWPPLVQKQAVLPVGNPSVPVSQPGARIREKRAPPLVPVSRPGLKVGNTNRG